MSKQATASSRVNFLVEQRDRASAEAFRLRRQIDKLEKEIAEMDNAIGGVNLGRELAAEEAAEKESSEDAPE